jgi:hypothetical protein
MKVNSIISSSVVLSLASLSMASQECQYCKRSDSNAGFLVTYEYCESKDECLQDAWLYINRRCESDGGWILGSKLDLVENCYSVEYEDERYFEFTENDFGSWNNATQRLDENTYLDITIDATLAVGRVVFDDTTNLGVERDGYQIGDLINVKQGEIETIRVFNGNEAGPLTFLLAISGAQFLSMSATAIATMFALT